MMGHKKMIVWQNIEKIDLVVNQKIMNRIPANQFTLRDQVIRASTSVSANFVEGYYAGSIREYLKFLSYSRRSLAELNNWSWQLYCKKYIDKDLFDEFEDLTIKTLYLFNRLIYSLRNKMNSSPSIS